MGAGKWLISRNTQGQIPYVTEQGNKSGEQGGKVDDQQIKSAEHGPWGVAARIALGAQPVTADGTCHRLIGR
jgi:hypothetical protein